MTISTNRNGEHSTDPQQLMALLNSADPPTAIFGLMDASTRACQHSLLEHAPHRLETLYWAGYANTPWCRDTPRPFTSVDWRIDEVVRETVSIIAQVRRGETVPPRCIQITPRLVDPPHNLYFNRTSITP
jgi:DNA-binding LacI/PurR family transcriptional regulator